MGWPVFSSDVDRQAVEALIDRRSLGDGSREDLERKVRSIIAQVRARGDAALVEYTRCFDGVEIPPNRLRLTPEEIAAGAAAVDPELRRAIDRAAGNIRRFHQLQQRREITQVNEAGGRLELRFVPMARVGIYVPGGAGGTTPLISTALMAAIPAKVAGVGSIAVFSPPRADGSLAPGLLAALSLVGVDEVYRVGGAQAVAAMAYGTESIRPVVKIVGPGNRYVSEAKRQVYGRVGLDMPAGPSEVAIIADNTADPRLLALDLLAQAEHDAEAGAFLFTPERSLAVEVAREVERILAGLPRGATARSSLAGYGAAVITQDLDEALDWVERLAPEHLEIVTADPEALAARVRTAGAVFLGPFSPEALGDYVAGCNHVLPTNGTARFASGLGVDDFLRRMCVLNYSQSAFRADAPAGVALARAECLAAHALSLQRRLEEEDRR